MIGVIAVLVVALAIASAWARRGYYVAFNDADVVVVYRGRTRRVLWFDPTVDAPSQLDAATSSTRPRSSGSSASPASIPGPERENFVAEQLETTTTTSTTTTTTTTTTVQPSTTPPTTTAP